MKSLNEIVNLGTQLSKDELRDVDGGSGRGFYNWYHKYINPSMSAVGTFAESATDLWGHHI